MLVEISDTQVWTEFRRFPVSGIWMKSIHLLSSSRRQLSVLPDAGANVAADAAPPRGQGQGQTTATANGHAEEARLQQVLRAGFG